MDDEQRDRWYEASNVGPRPGRGPPGRRWQTGEGDRYLGAFVVDAVRQALARGTQNLKGRAATVVENGRAMMARGKRAPAPSGIVTSPAEPAPDPIAAVLATFAPPAEKSPTPEPTSSAAAAAPVLAAALPVTSVQTPVTEAALAAIVATRQPIRPEMPSAAGLVGGLPSLVTGAAAILLTIWFLSIAAHAVFGAYWSLMLQSTFSQPSPPTPFQFPFPLPPQRR